MRLLLRKIAILLIAAGLVIGGATSHALAGASADAAAAMHESHQIQNYADLAIEPGEHDCAQITADASGDTPSPPRNDGPCKKCCAACMSVSVIPDAPTPLLMVSRPFVIHVATRTTLVAHDVPTDPGIPKPL